MGDGGLPPRSASPYRRPVALTQFEEDLVAALAGIHLGCACGRPAALLCLGAWKSERRWELVCVLHLAARSTDWRDYEVAALRMAQGWAVREELLARVPVSLDGCSPMLQRELEEAVRERLVLRASQAGLPVSSRDRRDAAWTSVVSRYKQHDAALYGRFGAAVLDWSQEGLFESGPPYELGLGVPEPAPYFGRLVGKQKVRRKVPHWDDRPSSANWPAIAGGILLAWFALHLVLALGT